MMGRFGSVRTVCSGLKLSNRRVPSALLSSLLLTFVACAVPLVAQGPGAPADGRVRQFYFDTLGYTEVWVTFTPAPVAGTDASPLTLNVTIRYTGKPVKGPLEAAPDAIVLRATSNPFFNPLVVRQPVVRISVDGDLVWDPSLPVNFYASGGINCEGCAPDTVDVRIPLDALRRIATGTRVEGHALGFAFELRSVEQDLLRKLLQVVFG